MLPGEERIAHSRCSRVEVGLRENLGIDEAMAHLLSNERGFLVESMLSVHSFE